jgi:hypothetical protein
MGQIKFFPTDRAKKINIDQLKELRELQYLITGARNEMLNRISDMPQYWKVVEKSLFHEKFKQRIKLVQ